MTHPLELDLEAAYRVMQTDVLNLIEKAEREGWTPEQLIRNVEELVMDGEDEMVGALNTPVGKAGLLRSMQVVLKSMASLVVEKGKPHKIGDVFEVKAGWMLKLPSGEWKKLGPPGGPPPTKEQIEAANAKHDATAASGAPPAPAPAPAATTGGNQTQSQKAEAWATMAKTKGPAGTKNVEENIVGWLENQGLSPVEAQDVLDNADDATKWDILKGNYNVASNKPTQGAAPAPGAAPAKPPKWAGALKDPGAGVVATEAYLDKFETFDLDGYEELIQDIALDMAGDYGATHQTGDDDADMQAAHDHASKLMGAMMPSELFQYAKKKNMLPFQQAGASAGAAAPAGAPKAPGSAPASPAPKAPAAATSGGPWNPTNPVPSEPIGKPLKDVVDHGSPGGSTGAKKVEYTAADGSKRMGVIKFGGMQGSENPDHAAEENKANTIYRALGIPVHQSQMVEHDGKKALLSDWIEDITPVRDLAPAERAKAVAEAKKSMAVDALLGNWDVTGSDGDNIAWDAKTGTLYRIDNGGALRYRGQGKPKGAKFGTDVSELDKMRDAATNAGKYYQGMSDAEVVKQVEDLVPRFASMINSGVLKDPDLVTTLKARMQNMHDWAKAHKASKAKAPPAPKVATLTKKNAAGYPDITSPAHKKYRDALNMTKGSIYEAYNKRLREYQMTPQDVEHTEHMDAYIAETPERTWGGTSKLHRSASATSLKKAFAAIGMPEFSIGNGKTSKPPSGASWEEFFESNLVGSVFGDQTYQSTSWDEKWATNWGLSPHFSEAEASPTKGLAVMLHITGKMKGIHMHEAELAHKAGIANSSEPEFVTPRNKRYQITKVNKLVNGSGHLYLDLEVAVV